MRNSVTTDIESCGVLSLGGWAQICGDSIEHLLDVSVQSEGRQLHRHLKQALASAAKNINRVAFIDPWRVRVPPYDQSWEAELAGFSLLLAFWERLLARGKVVDLWLGDGITTAPFASRLLDVIPEMYQHDLCIAEIYLS